MTLAEALQEGLLVTATGVIIVFSVLIILMLTMMAMKKIFYKEEKSPKAAQAAKPEPVAAPAPVAAPTEDPNLVAVIAAAVAAYLNTSTYNLKVRSFRRIGNTSPDWNKAGLKETIDSRF